MCKEGCCQEIPEDWEAVEDIEGPLIEYHFDR